jgi:hypothetical protein
MTVVDRPTISGQFLGGFHAHSLPNKLRMLVSTVTLRTSQSAPSSARITAAMFDRCRRDRRLAPSQNAMRRAARQRPLARRRNRRRPHTRISASAELFGHRRPRVPVGVGASYCAAVCNFVQTCTAKERIVKAAPHRKVSCNGEIRDCQGKHFR